MLEPAVCNGRAFQIEALDAVMPGEGLQAAIGYPRVVQAYRRQRVQSQQQLNIGIGELRRFSEPESGRARSTAGQLAKP